MAIVLQNRYKFDPMTDLIGKGAYGECYKVLDKKTNTVVVLKQVACERAGGNMAQCLQEVDMLFYVQHPRICRLIEHFEDEIKGQNSLCIVMDFYANRDVRTYLNSNFKHLSDAPVALRQRWMLQFVQAIQFLHENKIIHRDIKLEEGLLSEQLDMFLGDFGIAKNIQNQPATTFIGTPYTIAPEIINLEPGHTYNEKCDIWSLGCVWYELITGMKPFAAQSQYLLLMKMSKGEFNPIPPDQMPKFAAMCTKMLQLDPERRPSAAEICNEFCDEINELNGNKEAINGNNIPLDGRALIQNIVSQQQNEDQQQE